MNANKQLGQLMPYQYTGGYTDGNTGLVHLDARWYNPHTSRFVQPDYWNFKNTYLPTEIQHELMKYTGLNTNQLLRDPSQQLAYGYVSGNPLVWVDPFGLANIYSDWWNGNLDDVSFSMKPLNPEINQDTLDGVSNTLAITAVGSAVIGAKPVTLVAGAGSTITGLMSAAMDENPVQAVVTEAAGIYTGKRFADAFETIAKGTTDVIDGTTKSNIIDASKEQISNSVGDQFTTPQNSSNNQGCENK